MYACEKEFPGMVLDKKKVITLASRPKKTLSTGCNGPGSLFISKVESLNAASLPNASNKVVIKPLDGKQAHTTKSVGCKTVAVTVPIIGTLLPPTTTIKIIQKPTTSPLTANLGSVSRQQLNCRNQRTKLIPLMPKPTMNVSAVQRPANYSPFKSTLSIKSVTSLNPFSSHIRNVYPVQRLVGPKAERVPKPITTKPQILTISAHKLNENDASNGPIDYDNIIANANTSYKVRKTKFLRIPVDNFRNVQDIQQQAVVNDNSAATTPRKRKSLAVFMREVNSIASTATPADDPLAIEQGFDSSNSLQCNIQSATKVQTIVMENEETTNHNLTNSVDGECASDIEDTYRNALRDTGSNAEKETETGNEALDHNKITMHTTSCNKFVQTTDSAPNSSQLLYQISEMKRKLKDQEEEITALKAIIELMQRENDIADMDND